MHEEIPLKLIQYWYFPKLDGSYRPLGESVTSRFKALNSSKHLRKTYQLRSIKNNSQNSSKISMAHKPHSRTCMLRIKLARFDDQKGFLLVVQCSRLLVKLVRVWTKCREADQIFIWQQGWASEPNLCPINAPFAVTGSSPSARWCHWMVFALKGAVAP